MKGLTASWPALALALFIAVALQMPFASGAAAEAAPDGQRPLAGILFDPHGPNLQPGAWLWSADKGWSWIPAQPLETGGALQPTTNAPAFPQNPGAFWFVPTDQPAVYWVWDVYNFGTDDTGYSSWAPRWRLVSDEPFLGS